VGSFEREKVGFMVDQARLGTSSCLAKIFPSAHGTQPSVHGTHPSALGTGPISLGTDPTPAWHMPKLGWVRPNLCLAKAKQRCHACQHQ